jgi:hypothetical protein
LRKAAKTRNEAMRLGVEFFSAVLTAEMAEILTEKERHMCDETRRAAEKPLKY